MLATIRVAIDTQYKISFDYRREDGTPSQRTVWPLGLFFWGTVWTLGGWCELRNSFRNFRLDRMLMVEQQDEQYPLLEGRRLNDMIREFCEHEEEAENAAV